MMRGLLLSICLFAFVPGIKAQNYNTDLIPKDLLPYARAVIRNQEEIVEVKDLDDVTYCKKEAITVLNKNGDDLAHVVIEHDKINSIKFVKGLVYNSLGQQIGKFSESNFDDVSAGNDFSLFEDIRVKHYLPAVTEYPYTIAYEYETRSKQSLDIETWKPYPHTGLAVEKSTFTFICKPGLNIKYKETNISTKVKIGLNGQGLKTYSWELNNQKAVKNEPYSPNWDVFSSSVQIAPLTFMYYGINGTYNNWQELGKWEYNKLVADRQALPPETIERVRNLTKDIADPKLKAKKIYEYMQDKTHYISVQVGIGGLQPFFAADVDKQNYGDCKALVNYTQALLKAVNIDSYYCVVEANEDYKISLLNDFASMAQGNHIILCLPFKNDTTWADCTSQTLPFGYLGSFTDDRNVLACTPTGGILMHTPKYSSEDNLKSRKANFTINTDGLLSGEMETTFKGACYEYRESLTNESKTEQDKILQKIYPFNNLKIERCDIKQLKSFNPVTTEIIKLNARDYASLSDGKYFFLLNAVNRITETPRQVRNRSNVVFINRGYTDNDEITYKIPAGYKLEKEPLNVTLEKPFGKFSATMSMVGDQLVYKRKLVINDGTYSKETYQDLVDFYQSIVDVDEYNVVLIKN